MKNKEFYSREHLWYPPILAIILNGIYILSTNFAEPDNFSWIFLGKTIIQFYAYLFFTSYVDRQLTKKEISQGRTQLVLVFLLGWLLSLVFGIIFYIVVKQSFIVYYQQNDQIGFSHLLINALSITVGYVLIFCIYLVAKSYQKQLQIERQNAAFEKEKLQMNYELLYNKLEPHFLFNNLNTLHSMIVANNPTAELFVMSLSKVMRYSFQSQDKMSVPIKEELEVMQHYLTILKERIGKPLSHTPIEAIKLEGTIIPMTLPNLLENIVKHNEISADKPLHIGLRATPGYLEVSNTLNLKPKAAANHKGGLNTLNEMYLIKTGHSITYYTEKLTFYVKIPFLES